MRFRLKHALMTALPLLLIGAGKIDWQDMVESDWVYSIATRFSLVDGKKVHYPTPTKELAHLLENSSETAALRHLADTRLELGDRKGAWEAMTKWAELEGALAWSEAARWAIAHNSIPEAFYAAERAMPRLDLENKRSLCNERIRWAEQHPSVADPMALIKARVDLFPDDANALESWLRRLIKDHHFDDADKAIDSTQALSKERKMLLRSDLYADQTKYKQAFKILDEAIAEPWSMDFRKAYATRVNQGFPNGPQIWRSQLEKTFDAEVLIRLCTWFQGQGRGDSATDLVRQMERRHGSTLNRNQHLLLSRLYAEVDAVPEAFRSALAAAHLGDPKSQQDDLLRLAHLALQASSRPISIGITNDETYRWAAQVDRTPGFWTGAISLFLTGTSFEQSLNQLETESLPDRTFATALALGEELARRAPKHHGLPTLRAAFMARHVERGDGEKAMLLLPLLENTSIADVARCVALLAARQVKVPLQEELRLMKARLAHLAPDGSKPTLDDDYDHHNENDSNYYDSGAPSWSQLPKNDIERYSQTLSQYIGRLDYLDKSHQTSVSLILGEMDRMPDAEELWLDLSSRLESWGLDDDLGPRYIQALRGFKGETIWPRLVRWYAKRNYQKELKDLAETLTQRFRSSDIFARVQFSDIHLAVPEQPPIKDGVRMVPWAEWVRFKALERFPHNPRVVSEAQRLVTQSNWQRNYQNAERRQSGQNGPVIIPDSLMQTKQWAIFFIDPGARESWFREVMKTGKLLQILETMEALESKTPVEDMILSEGWSRLSQYEKALPATERLSAAYPGNENMAAQTLSLYRSLNSIGYDYIKSAHVLVARTAPSLEYPYNLWTELGEMEEERENPDSAKKVWLSLLEREPRSQSRISDLATLLWDYNHDRDALNVIEEGRKRIDMPRFLAFEAGVLQENLQDIDGAMSEYLAALQQDNYQTDYYFTDQRALSRIAQIIARQRVYNIVENRIQSLRPGQVNDEKRLLSYFPLITLNPSNLRESNDWIDFVNNPNDPIGREDASQKRIEARSMAQDAIKRIGNLILTKAELMVPKASSPEFLAACQTWINRTAPDRWSQDRLASYENASMARRAELTINTEERIQLEIERASFLVSKGRTRDADMVWSLLNTHIASLPDGVTKMKAEAAKALFLEKNNRSSDAGAEWKRLSERYPWSLGLLEDHLAFLRRTGASLESRVLLEDVSNRAAIGYRLPLLQQLAKQSLAENDTARAYRATQGILQETNLSFEDRLEAVEALARLSIKADRTWDPSQFVKEQTASFNQDYLPDLYQHIAIAADSEGARKTAMEMWIEALNRRSDRQWIQSACRSAMAGGLESELLSFFERQHQRSPRDVRWAVAVRDICRNLYKVDETIQAAKTAVAIRPDREDLWREAVDIMVLADRVKEAADYLEDWHKLRPSDEGTASWRAKLYANAGEEELAFAVEKLTLDAFQKESKNTREYENRRARAAIRLMENGFVSQALHIYSPQGDILALTKSEVSTYQQARLAMHSGQLIKLLKASVTDESKLYSIASALDDIGRPENREEVIRHLLPQFSAPLQTRRSALRQWHGFIHYAKIDGALRLAAASGYISNKPGPWQQNPSAPFLQKAGDILIPSSYSSNDRAVLNEPNLEWLWAEDLARKDKSEELLIFLMPRWNETMGLVFGNSGQDSGTSQLNWSKILERPSILEAWARAVPNKPEMIQQLNRIMSDRHLWDRFRTLAARGWKQDVLVDLVTPDTRTAWYEFQKTEPQITDSIIQARTKQTNQVAQAIERLILDSPNAADDPIIVKLRGPQTLGGILGKDAQWIWPEFALRRNRNGEIDEPEEYRSIGVGVDAGRFPAAFWSQNPGEAWYVLEALARYRKEDKTAPLLPMEYTKQGNEALLAINLARSLGDIALANELDAQRPGPGNDWLRVKTRIQLHSQSKDTEKAIEIWKKYIRERQKSITSTEMFELAQFASQNTLPSILELFDASQPLHPELLASLVNTNVSAFKKYKTADITMFRFILSNLWVQNETGLNTAQVRFWLRELWATGSTELPSSRGLSKLGGLWGHTHPWLSQQPVFQRIEAIDAVENGGDDLIKLLRKSDQNDANQTLMLRAHLAMGNNKSALSMVERWIQENRRSDLGSAEGQYWTDSESNSYYKYNRPLVERIRLWVDAFGNSDARLEAVKRFSEILKEHYENGAVSQDVWILAFDLCKPEDRPALHNALEHSWFRGQVNSGNLGGLIEIMAKHMPQEAQKWLKRWPMDFSFRHTNQRANILIALKQSREAAKVYESARKRAPWSPADDIKAFDAWRRLDVGTNGPALWLAALAHWKGNSANSLVAQLKSHPLDCFSATSALQTAKAASEEEIVRIEQSLKSVISNSETYVLARIKAARAWLPISWRTATQYAEDNAEYYYHAMLSRKLGTDDINNAMEDLVRIYRSNSDTHNMQAALRILTDRNSKGLNALKAELDSMPITEKVVSYRIIDDRPAPILPKDLTWTLLNKLLLSEGK
jgi:hypothetical protein